MAFPTIPTSAAGRALAVTATSPSGTHTSPNLSSLTKNSGDLLIAIVIIYDGNSTNAEFSSWGGGFTEFGDAATTTDVSIGVAYKFSTGSETGTFTVTSSDTSTNDSAFLLLSISGAHASAVPEFGGYATGTNPDATSISPSWGADDTLWIAVGGAGETSTAGSFTGIIGAPSSYGDLFTSGISADVVGGIEGGVAFRQLNAASEDPGAWNTDTSNARGAAAIIAVRPAPAAQTIGALDLLDPTSAVYAPTIQPGPVTIGALDLLDPTSAVYAPTLTPISAIGALPLLDPGSDLYAPTLTVGAAMVGPLALLDPTSAVYAPTVSFPGGATQSVGDLPLLDPSSAVYAPTVTPGPVTVGALALLDPVSAVYAPTLVPISAIGALGLLDPTSAIYAPTLTVGPATVTLGLLDPGSAIYAPTVDGGETIVALIASRSRRLRQLPAPAPADQWAALPLIPTTSAVYAPTLEAIDDEAVLGLDDESLLFV